MLPEEQEENTPASIETLIYRYRSLKNGAARLKAEMDTIKEVITPIIDEQGNWKDDIGYARRITKGESVSYSGDLDNVVFAWVRSEDPILRTQGELAMAFRKVRSGSSYIQIK